MMMMNMLSDQHMSNDLRIIIPGTSWNKLNRNCRYLGKGVSEGTKTQFV